MIEWTVKTGNPENDLTRIHDSFPKLSIDGSEGFQLDLNNKNSRQNFEGETSWKLILIDYAFPLSLMRN